MWHGGKISKHSQSSFNVFTSEAKYTAIAPQKNKQMMRSQSMLLIKFLPTILLLRFYNNKSCCYRLRWNCRKESWWSWYHHFPSLGKVVLCRRRHKRRWQWHCCHLIHSKKNAKNKKGGGEGSLPSSSHFYHHIEAPLAATTLKLLLLGHS
jgi:hypothetical protein